jgi:tetratricopeptide (TPR) repeat protein
MWRLGASLALAGALSACATAGPPGPGALPADLPVGLPREARVAEVPFYPQEDMYCGPASLAMVLTWSGAPATQEKVAEAIYTPGREGTLQHDLLAGARREGRIAAPVPGLAGLLGELAEGHPVLVLQNLALDWAPQWHYAVAIGYDLDEDEIVLHSGLEPERAMSLSTFERTWARAERWGVVVLPPGTLPATAGEAEVLEAAVGIERAGRPAEAAQAYAAILDRWPSSFAALMGLGNARYAAGQILGAESAFRTAASLHPDAAPAWNNLAHVLAAQGELAEALQAAKRAVDLGGPKDAAYRETLREIEQRSI